VKKLTQSGLALPSGVGHREEVLISNGDGTISWKKPFSLSSRDSLPSDIRLKRSVAKLADGYVSKIMRLRPVSFIWKESGENDIGFIAQQVKRVLPEMVKKEGDDFEVRYQKMIVPLIKAFQENQKEMERLKKRIEELEKTLKEKK
jgi:hypothetical protein